MVVFVLYYKWDRFEKGGGCSSDFWSGLKVKIHVLVCGGI